MKWVIPQGDVVLSVSHQQLNVLVLGGAVRCCVVHKTNDGWIALWGSGGVMDDASIQDSLSQKKPQDHLNGHDGQPCPK